MSGVKVYNGKILATANGIAAHDDCCCGGDCPSDCSGCDDSYTITVAGVSNIFPGPCESFNDTFTVTKSGCVWSVSEGGVIVTLRCVDALYWEILLSISAPLWLLYFYNYTLGVGCPPTGIYIDPSSACNVTAATCVLA